MTNKISYFINQIRNYKEIENLDIDFFNYNRRKKIWNLFSKKIINLNFNNSDEQELFKNFSQISNQYIPFLIAMYLDIGEKKNLKNKFIKLDVDKSVIELSREIKKEYFDVKKVNNYKIFLRNLSYKNFSFNGPKINILDHNKNCNDWIYNNTSYRFIYTPSNNFEIFSKKNFSFSNKRYSNDKLVLDLTQKILKKSLEIFNVLNHNLKIKLKFENVIYRLVKLILSNIKFNSDNLIDKKIPKVAISNISGFLPSRILSNRIIKLNGKVLRFQHGAGILKGSFLSTVLNDLNSCNVFYFNNNIELRIANSIYNEKIKNLINFKKLNIKKIIQNKNIKKSFNKNKELKVIYSPSNFESNRMPGPGNIHDIDYLKLQNEIINCLSKKYQITYQPHPKLNISNFKNPANKFRNNEKFFEKQLDKHNVFIFDSYISSTFWIALNNSKPIILLEYFSINDEKNYLIKNLKKRCAYLKLKLNTNLNTINFDKLIEDSFRKTKCKKNFGFNSN